MKEKILNVLFILFGLFMANAGLNKFTNHMPMGEPSEGMQELFGHLMAVGWILPLVGIVELIGGILIIIPKTRLIGAITLLPIMTGILLTHIINDPANLPMALVFFVLNAVILVMGRTKLCDLKN